MSGKSEVISKTQCAQSLDPRWQAVVSGDASADGTFVYAVKTTGIYCAPSCPSRQPNP